MLASSLETDSMSFADFSHCARYIVLYHYCVNFKFLMDKNSEELFICLLHLYIFFSDVSDIFFPIKKKFTCFLYVEFQELFVYVGYKYFIRFTNVFSQSVVYLFTFFVISFSKAEVFNIDGPVYQIFLSYDCF